jgi:hypothetical protein
MKGVISMVIKEVLGGMLGIAIVMLGISIFIN